MSATSTKQRILCVDDEPSVLQGIARNLGRAFDVHVATSGADGLAILRQHPGFSVVVSDMRMPAMTGAVFLAEARALLPDVPRLLLTGQADLDSAIAAVNDGGIFRFLVKPCPPPALQAAVEAAAQLYRHITAERELLEKTLLGSIQAMLDVLALVDPVAFGRATRIKALAVQLATGLGLVERWPVEVAAMLSELGHATLPAELLEKLQAGQPLLASEQELVDRMPAVAEQILGHIPRLEPVRAILLAQGLSFWHGDALAPGARADAQRSAQVVKVARDFMALEARGESTTAALATLRGRADRYDPAVLEVLAATSGALPSADDVRELPLAALRRGMVFAEDVRLSNGALFMARGHEVNAGLLERLRNVRPGTVREPVRVRVPAERAG